MYINVSELLKSYTFLHTLSLRSSAHRPPCMCYYSRFWPQASESIVLKFDWFTALTSIQGCTLYFFSFFSRKTNYSTPQHYIYIYIYAYNTPYTHTQRIWTNSIWKTLIRHFNRNTRIPAHSRYYPVSQSRS